MKRTVLLIALCMLSLMATSALAQTLREACPIAQFETWDKERNRLACEARYNERMEAIRNNPEQYIDEANRRARNAEDESYRQEIRLREAERKADELERKTNDLERKHWPY